MEEAENFLWQYRGSLREWRRLCDEAEELRTASNRIASDFSGTIVDENEFKKVESALKDIEGIIAKEDAAKLLVGARRTEVESAINVLPGGRHRDVMLLRYINGMSWDAISEKLHYDKRHLRRIKRESIAILKEKGVL